MLTRFEKRGKQTRFAYLLSKKAGRDNRFAYLLCKKAVMPHAAKTRYKIISIPAL
ncbi:MAG: hypothetical protein ACI90V_008571 [Bacillariaceae sp.]